MTLSRETILEIGRKRAEKNQKSNTKNMKSLLGEFFISSPKTKNKGDEDRGGRKG